MKTTVILVVVFVVRISAYLIKVPTLVPLQPESAPVAWVNLQKLVIPLFDNVCEDSSDFTINRLAKEFVANATDDNFSNPNVLTNLQILISSKGLLAKEEIFTDYNTDHLYELQVIYELLYYSKSFDKFYEAAAWARQHLNCGLYVNAMYMAIQHRPDTNKLSIPAPYELVPNYFITKNVILQGVYIVTDQKNYESENIHVEGNAYTIDANYTAMFYDNDDESKLAYFREDIGLNSYYFLSKLKQAPWFNSNINGKYGEDVYQMMKQLMGRYNLERYSNGLPELDSLNWNSSFDDTYDPMLIYANGNEFIHRSAPVELPDNEDVALLQTIENSIGTVVLHMRDTEYNKTQILNHLMEILVTSDRSYETLARRLLGKDHTDNGSPSVLEHYLTSLRDPAFWKINYKIVEIINGALNLLPSYNKNELYFPGVEIVNIDVKKIMTVFDYYEFDVTDSLKINENETLQIKISQPRLNHKPFTIKITISSIVSQKGLMKIFLGPKLLPSELITKKNFFILLDQFETNLKIGSNVITRTSNDMRQFSEDFMSLKMLRNKVQDAEFGLNSLQFETIESQSGYPSRLIFPKGSSQGLPLQLFAFIAPYTKATIGEFYSVIGRDFNTAILSPGYPLDLSIKNSLLFELPNALLKDIIVTHNGDNKVQNYMKSGVNKKWYGGDNYPSAQPNYSVNKNEPFDYNSKKGQYGKNENNLIKRDEYIISEPAIENVHFNSKDDQYENDAPHLKLASPGFNWASKRKEPFDYKSLEYNRDKYEMNDKYSNKNDKYKNKNSFQNGYTSTGSEVKTLDNSFTEKTLVNINEIKETKLFPVSGETDQVQDNFQNIKIEPQLEFIAPKRRFTIYDSIFNSLNDDSLEEKVFEKK